MTRAEYSAHIYLSGIAAATARIKELDEEIDYQRGLVQTKDLTADRVQTSGIGNPTEQRAFKVLALFERLEDMKVELMEHRVKALQAMGEAKLTEAEETAIIRRYFCEGRPPTWEEIAEQIGYSEKHIYKVRRRALLKLAAVIGKKEAVE